MSIDVKVQQKRLIRMVVIDGVCILLAMVAAVAFMGFHVEWAKWAFFAAIAAAFAAQMWLIAGFARLK